MSLDNYLREGGQASAMRGRLFDLYEKGASAYRDKKYDQALLCFTEILRTKLEPRIAAVIYVARSNTFYAKGEFKKAIADAMEAIRLDPRSARAYNTRALAYWGLGDRSKAIEDLDAAIRLDRNFVEAKRNRELVGREPGRDLAPTGRVNSFVKEGIAACENKQFEQCIASLTAALQLKPDTMVAARIYNTRAQVYGKNSHFRKALADANEAIRLDRQLGEAYNTRGCAYDALGDRTKAMSDFETAIRLAPNYAPARNNRARLLGQSQ